MSATVPHAPNRYHRVQQKGILTIRGNIHIS